LGYSCDERVSQVRAGLASSALLPDANFMPGSLSVQRASCTDQIVTGTTARKNAKPVCSKAGCWDDPGLRPFEFRSGSRARVFVGISVITQHAFYRDDTAEMALAR
jgi:hypothetical protein